MEGNAIMVHRSGQYVLSKGLNVTTWPALTAGRLTRLRCGKLSATFAPADANLAAASRPAGDELEGGPRWAPWTSSTRWTTCSSRTATG